MRFSVSRRSSSRRESRSVDRERFFKDVIDCVDGVNVCGFCSVLLL